MDETHFCDWTMICLGLIPCVCATMSEALKKMSLDKTLKLGARNVVSRNMNQHEFLKTLTILETRPNILRITISQLQSWHTQNEAGQIHVEQGARCSHLPGPPSD